MKKKRFASYLLTGKVATSPVLINNSFADVVPSYQDLLSSQASLIELPQNNVRLYSLDSGNNNYGAFSPYGGTAAAICNTDVPTTINIVITGTHPGDTVYLAASSNKDDGAFQHLRPEIRVGSADFTIISSFQLDHSPLEEEGGDFTHSTAPISLPVNIDQLAQANLLHNGRMYIQAVIFSTNDASMWNSARVSELDTIEVSAAGCPASSSYNGGSTYNGGSAY